MRTARLCSLLLLLSSMAHAASPKSCVIVRKPTAQQRAQSAGDVERLLDAYEAQASDAGAWPAALLALFNRFPLPSVNVLMAQHHPSWNTPEKRLVAYVEATRQDPGDYADRAAVAKTIERIEDTLLPGVRRWPLVTVEARGVARREEMALLDVRIGGEACTGEPIWATAPYSVSWVNKGRRLSATVAPLRPGNSDQCLAIDGDAVGPCDGPLRAVDARPVVTASPASPPPAPNPAAAPDQVTPPSMDYRFAIPGLALAAVGFGLGAYAQNRVETYMDRAEAGECHDRQCSASGMDDVVTAGNWKTIYYVAGAGGLLGVGILLTSGHRYYAEWLFPSSKHPEHTARSGPPSVVPIVAAGGAGVRVESRF